MKFKLCNAFMLNYQASMAAVNLKNIIAQNHYPDF